MKKLSPYGTHRVLYPEGALPQAADRIDNSMICEANEILVDVERLNIDSASFNQIRTASNNDPEDMVEMILSIVSMRGKMQNPVTGSGGMFLGRIAEIGKDVETEAKVGDEIASLVSLSLTPLRIDRILSIDMEKDQVDIVGQAILFTSGIFAKVPEDIPANIALSALDVAGAPAQTAKICKKGDTVLILGASGKSGLLCAYQAKKSVGPSGRVIGFIPDNPQRNDLERLGVCDIILTGDARNPVDTLERLLVATNGEKADVTINVVNVPGTEMASILPTKPDGLVYFFGMATSFAKAALGAEGVASEARMLIGNGYTKGHAELTLNLLRESKQLMAIFEHRYGKGE